MLKWTGESIPNDDRSLRTVFRRFLTGADRVGGERSVNRVNLALIGRALVRWENAASPFGRARGGKRGPARLWAGLASPLPSRADPQKIFGPLFSRCRNRACGPRLETEI